MADLYADIDAIHAEMVKLSEEELRNEIGILRAYAAEWQARYMKAEGERLSERALRVKYGAVLGKIAGNMQSGPLWDRHNLDDEMGGVSEPDFEGAYDHFIAICREALEGK